MTRAALGADAAAAGAPVPGREPAARAGRRRRGRAGRALGHRPADARSAAARIPRAHEVALDWQAFAFLLLVCVATAVLFGLAPALAAARVDVQSITRESGGHATMAGRYGRLRDALVVLEVALAFVLAVGAATRDARDGPAAARRQRDGDRERADAAPHAARAGRRLRAIEQRVAAVPGVAAAGFTQLVPLQNWGWDADFSVRGRRLPDRDRSPVCATSRPATSGRSASRSCAAATFTAQDDARRAAGHRDQRGAGAALLSRRGSGGPGARSRHHRRRRRRRASGRARSAGRARDLLPGRAERDDGVGHRHVARSCARPAPPERAVEAIRAAVREVNPNLADLQRQDDGRRS